jgi:hypothetical protein
MFADTIVGATNRNGIGCGWRPECLWIFFPERRRFAPIFGLSKFWSRMFASTIAGATGRSGIECG